MGRKKTQVGSAQNIQDVITDANFGDDRLSRFYMARSQILGFSIGFRRRFYNILALPYSK